MAVETETSTHITGGKRIFSLEDASVFADKDVAFTYRGPQSGTFRDGKVAVAFGKLQMPEESEVSQGRSTIRISEYIERGGSPSSWNIPTSELDRFKLVIREATAEEIEGKLLSYQHN